MNDGTLLHRQVNPIWIQNNRPTSQTFRPTPKDKHRLSLYDGDLITAQNSFQHFVGQGYRSVGVLSISVGECKLHDLEACSSPEVFEEHAHIDFSHLAENQIKSKGKQLLALAEARGWQYRQDQ